MSTRRRNGSNRDTAKDIMLGLAPSGTAPRQPKEGVSQQGRSTSIGRSRGKSADYNSKVVSRDTSVEDIHRKLRNLESQNRELLEAEKNARRRLEQNQESLQRKIANTDNAASSRDVEDLRRQLGQFDGKFSNLSGELKQLRSALDRQVNDLMHINNEIKSRPTVDPNKIASSAQQMENKVRDMHSQMMALRQALDREQQERQREARVLNDNITRLQDYIRQNENSKNEILNSLSKKGDMDKDKLNEETRRLNEKIGLITAEVTRNMNDTQNRIRDEMNAKIGSLDSAMRSQIDARIDSDKDSKRKLEEKLRSQGETIDTLQKNMTSEKAKHKDRFQKVNEALAALEQHLELGSNKVDQKVSQEAKDRKMHEKSLLSRMNEIESRLSNHTSAMNKTIDDLEAGKEKRTAPPPPLDVDALRREMEAIAADKNKLSMEGLLKLEEKMSKMQTGLHRDKREMADRVAELSDNDQMQKMKAKLNQLDELQEDMEKAHDRIADKVERQIPQDLNELSAKADNIKHQLNARIDKEEEERYLAIKELQEAYAKLMKSKAGAAAAEANGDGAMRRDVDECKIAIKKLAESVTTVKNVLDKKIGDEKIKRENEIDRLERMVK